MIRGIDGWWNNLGIQKLHLVCRLAGLKYSDLRSEMKVYGRTANIVSGSDWDYIPVEKQKKLEKVYISYFMIKGIR